MRVYGTIKSDILSVLDIPQENLAPYSIDTLCLTDKNGIPFNIDFEEGDYSIITETQSYPDAPVVGEGECLLDFRLKSLGCTFNSEWDKLARTEGIDDLENDIKLFKESKLESIVLYIPETAVSQDYNEKIPEVKFETIYLKVAIQQFNAGEMNEAEIEYDLSDVVVEIE